MPLSERAESVWFTVLASTQMLLSMALVLTSALGFDKSTFGWATSASITLGASFSLSAHCALVVCAVRMPQKLDYDVLLGVSVGLLLLFVETAALAASDGNVFVAFIDKQSRIAEDRHPLPPECTLGGTCGWNVLTNEMKAAALGAPTMRDPVITVSLFCMVVQLAIIVVGAYQRCGLTASDDRYVK